MTHDDGTAQVATLARRLHELRLLRDEPWYASSGGAAAGRQPVQELVEAAWWRRAAGKRRRCAGVGPWT